MSEQRPNPYAGDPGAQPGGGPHPWDPYLWGPGDPGGDGAGFALGEITIAGDLILTPSGAMPLRGAVWNAADFSRTERRIPAHAIVLAVVFSLFCLVGLLFLLMREKVTTGFVQVTVAGGGRYHATMVPATDPYTAQWVVGRVEVARSLSS
ncbi:hypothetical protein AB0P15_22680 [Streptomyces sp. NPDC087917]|uniref:hypothetical protein n=1 Tax=unclassified Streptomyces TaxID=2593676 RepID=UPI0034322D33